MELNIILLIILLILYPAVYFHGRYAKAGVGEKPMILNSTIVEFLLNIALLAFIGLSIWLLIESWKTFLIVIAVIMGAGFINGMVKR